MRMVKMKPQQLTLDKAIQKFLLVKESQHTGEETIGILPFLFNTVSRCGEVGLERRIGRNILKLLYS